MKHVFGIEDELTVEEVETVSGGSLLQRLGNRLRRPGPCKPPVYTTQALGEEGGDGSNDLTTMAIGEEGGGPF